MTYWYSFEGNFKGYSAYYAGVIHYYTRNEVTGVITDEGTTKPGSFKTTCCLKDPLPE